MSTAEHNKPIPILDRGLLSFMVCMNTLNTHSVCKVGVREKIIHHLKGLQQEPFELIQHAQLLIALQTWPVSRHASHHSPANKIN